MDKLILVNFCFALLTSHVVQCVSSETEQESPGPALPRFYYDDDTFRQELPTLPAFNEPSKATNNSYTGDIKELQPLLNTYAENESISNSTKSTNKGNLITNQDQQNDKLLPFFIDFIKQKGDVRNSSTRNIKNDSYLDSSQPTKSFLPLGNRSADVDGETTTKGSVSTGKEQLPLNKNASGWLQNQELLNSFPKYQPEKQLPKHDPNLEELYEQNYTRPELLQMKLYQHDRDLKNKMVHQENPFFRTNTSQKNFSEWVKKLTSKSKPQLPNKKVQSKVMDDEKGDTFDDATSERNDKFYSYAKINGPIKDDSGKVHTQLSASDKLQQLFSQQKINNKYSSSPSSPGDSKRNKTFKNNDYDVEEEDDNEDKKTNDYIVDEESPEYNDAGNADSYNKNEKNYNANSDEDFANKNGIQGVKKDGSKKQTGRSNKEDKAAYETESGKAESEIDEYDLEDIIGDIDFNNQVKKEDSNNQTGKSNGKYETKSDKAVTENNQEDIDNVDFNIQSSIDDDNINENDTVVDSSDIDKTEEFSDGDADTAVALHDKAENSTSLSGTNSKNPQDTRRRVVKNSVEDWFNQEKKVDDEDYRNNAGSKTGSEEYKEEDDDDDDDIALGEHDKDDDDDDDEEYDVTKWSQHGDDDDTEWDDDTEDDFDESKNPIDELATKKRQPTAPTRMVLFYTWMVVAVLLIIVGVSTYQSRCRGFRFFGTKASNPKDDRKRLMEHEFV